MGLIDFFKRFGGWIKKAVQVVHEFVPNDVLAWAVSYVKAAAETGLDNAGKREWVVDRIHQRFPQVSESVIRLAVELAVRIVKSKL